MILTLIKKRKEAGNVKSFIFKPENSLIWTAGQYLIYSLEHKNPDLRGKMRFFTISAAPFEKYPSITTRIDKTKGSSFKKALDSLKPGDTINAKGPDGDFVVKNGNKQYVFIAGGIGITPFRSIIAAMNHKQLAMNITLLYSNKNKDIPFKSELEKITMTHPELKIHYFINPYRIDKNAVKKFVPDFKKPLYYISGPDPMVEKTEKLLLELGIKKENINLDYFSGYR